MAGFFYLCYTGSVHKIGEEVKLLKDYDWWVKAWNAYNNPPTKRFHWTRPMLSKGKFTSVVVLVIAIFAIPLIIRRAIADAKEDMMGKIELVAASSLRSVCPLCVSGWFTTLLPWNKPKKSKPVSPTRSVSKTNWKKTSKCQIYLVRPTPTYPPRPWFLRLHVHQQGREISNEGHTCCNRGRKSRTIRRQWKAG